MFRPRFKTVPCFPGIVLFGAIFCATARAAVQPSAQPALRPAQPAVRPLQPTARPVQSGLRPVQPAVRVVQPAKQPNYALDQALIRATDDAFVKAFNAANPKAIGALWAADARYIDESGEVVEGRTAIEMQYANTFRRRPGALMMISIDSIRFLSADMALEKGTARIKLPGRSDDMLTHYTVVHSKRGDQWVMVYGRDITYLPTAREDRLKDLEWLIGDWTAEAKDQPLRLHYEWVGQRKFIRSTGPVAKEGPTALSGSQFIGWNARLERIVTWHLDPQGGFGQDVWRKEGSKWVIEAKGTLRDGSESTAVNILNPIDADSFTWQSEKRTLDGANLPDAPPLKLVRVKPGK